jgi:hypothetical protein
MHQIPLKLAAMLQNVSVCIQFEAKDRDFIQYILYRLLKIRQILRLFYFENFPPHAVIIKPRKEEGQAWILEANHALFTPFQRDSFVTFFQNAAGT